MLSLTYRLNHVLIKSLHCHEFIVWFKQFRLSMTLGHTFDIIFVNWRAIFRQEKCIPVTRINCTLSIQMQILLITFKVNCHMDQLQYCYPIDNWLFCALHQILTLKQTVNMVIVSQQSLHP